jgi:hypothetical protein
MLRPDYRVSQGCVRGRKSWPLDCGMGRWEGCSHISMTGTFSLDSVSFVPLELTIKEKGVNKSTASPKISDIDAYQGKVQGNLLIS